MTHSIGLECFLRQHVHCQSVSLCCQSTPCLGALMSQMIYFKIRADAQLDKGDLTGLRLVVSNQRKLLDPGGTHGRSACLMTQAPRRRSISSFNNQRKERILVARDRSHHGKMWNEISNGRPAGTRINSWQFKSRSYSTLCFLASKPSHPLRELQQSTGSLGTH